jgi:IS1 family transposase
VEVIRHGKSTNGKQRYRCLNPECPYQTFSLNLAHPGRNREVKQQIVEMTLNGSGVRDIFRVLQVSTSTVIKEFKKNIQLESVNRKLLSQLQLEQVEVVIEPAEADTEPGVEESSLDEMWSYVGKKTNPRWLWNAIDRSTGQVLAYVFGTRKDEVFLQLKELLEPFGIKRFCTDGWGAYERHLPAELHEVGKRKPQRIERKHLRLRTRIKRLVRKTICFSLVGAYA